LSIDPRAKRLLDLLAVARGSGSGADVSPAARRTALNQLAELAAGPPPAVAEVRDLAVEGVPPMRLYDPAPGQVGGAVLYLHGGGWTAGSLETHDVLCRSLALHSGCKLVAVDYRQPPEHPRPAAVEDGLGALAWLARQATELGVDPRRIGVAGDSAGAHVAAELALRARDQAGSDWTQPDRAQSDPAAPRLALQLLICPILDPSGALPSRQEFRDGHFIDPDVFARDRQGYFGGEDQVASLLARPDLQGLPPTRIHAAEFDPFRDEALAYAQKLEGAGVEAQASLHAGMIHYFYAVAGALPAARPIVEAIGRQIGEILGRQEDA
jgi:acetyl esterase/lipase